MPLEHESNPTVELLDREGEGEGSHGEKDRIELEIEAEVDETVSLDDPESEEGAPTAMSSVVGIGDDTWEHGIVWEHDCPLVVLRIAEDRFDPNSAVRKVSATMVQAGPEHWAHWPPFVEMTVTVTPLPTFEGEDQPFSQISLLGVTGGRSALLERNTQTPLPAPHVAEELGLHPYLAQAVAGLIRFSLNRVRAISDEPLIAYVFSQTEAS